MLAYLSRYTHRVAISSRRILAFDGANVSFRVKDYRCEEGGQARVMTLSAGEFIRRFLLHVLPRGFHRIRHYGFLAGSNRKAGLAHIRAILGTPPPPRSTDSEPDARDAATDVREPCPCCGGPMRTVGSFAGWYQPRGPPFSAAPNRACTP
ncbi:hypothetical protein ASF57_19775 [Methylobacterium sp. Leaf117]|nr:hypothetical protein ASF57_19775 [Methylobacterium sp. Leaf117]